jgi:hypothetical protein
MTGFHEPCMGSPRLGAQRRLMSSTAPAAAPKVAMSYRWGALKTCGPTDRISPQVFPEACNRIINRSESPVLLSHFGSGTFVPLLGSAPGRQLLRQRGDTSRIRLQRGASSFAVDVGVRGCEGGRSCFGSWDW